jgi:hypothetical protein
VLAPQSEVLVTDDGLEALSPEIEADNQHDVRC